jgi:hypothetical protein
MGRVTMSVCAALVGLAATAPAQSTHARPLSILNNENPAEPGSFTLHFGGLGLRTSSNIISTTFELSVDPVRGTARFVSYVQQVEPLTLPGGLSTGDITVMVAEGSSTGFFDPSTRRFTTSELYEIHFTGNLSAFGLTSPVVLPSTSIGQVAVDPVAGGRVAMDWIGSGELSNPINPSNPLTFHYRCEVNTVFPAAPANVLGLALVPQLVGLRLPKEAERHLVGTLDQSLAQIQRENRPEAVHRLRTFIQQVNLLRSRGVIAEPGARELISGAVVIMQLLGLGS